MPETPTVVHQVWRIPRGETPSTLLRRLLPAATDLGPPSVGLLATESLAPGKVSPVARALKKLPELESLATQMTTPGTLVTVRALSTDTQPDRDPLSIDLLLGLLDGVPRSFPFENVAVQLRWSMPEPVVLHLNDMWWINGRRRSLSLVWTAMAEAASKAAPEPMPPVAALLSLLGKPKSMTRKPAAGSIAAPSPELSAIVQRHRVGLPARVAELALPHVLDPGIGEAAGPMKPLLVETFAPRGFDCRGGSGLFVLRRRTRSNNVVELHLDVGTWSHSFTGFLCVHVPGWRASLPLLVGGDGRQVAIRGAAGWARLVENLALLVDDLQSGFVAEIEAVAGVAPAWFEPGSSGAP
jgi:hypothetical protein